MGQQGQILTLTLTSVRFCCNSGTPTLYQPLHERLNELISSDPSQALLVRPPSALVSGGSRCPPLPSPSPDAASAPATSDSVDHHRAVRQAGTYIYVYILMSCIHVHIHIAHTQKDLRRLIQWIIIGPLGRRVRTTHILSVASMCTSMSNR
jgi:hypothetical protein